MRIIAGKSPNHNRPVTSTFSGFLPVGSVRREVVPCLDYPDRVRVILILAMVGFIALALVGLVKNTTDDSQTVLAGLDDLRLRFMPFVNNVPLCRYRKLVQVMMQSDILPWGERLKIAVTTDRATARHVPGGILYSARKNGATPHFSRLLRDLTTSEA
jgi:hypothetical protein